MAVYFCIDDLITALNTAPITAPTSAPTSTPTTTAQPGTQAGMANRLHNYVPVYTAPPQKNNTHSDDILTLSSQPNLLNMNEPTGAYKLAALLDDVPLYQINIELLLDHALSIRHHNHIVDTALRTAFGDQALPNTLHRAETDNEAAIVIEGSLRHPMIGHVDAITLAKIYINFYRALPHGHDDFNFETHILGRHPEPFRTQFDGYLIGSKGAIRADILIGFGIRNDYDPRRPLEKYASEGQTKARKIMDDMAQDDIRELLWAWMECDDYQSRKCHDIGRILSISELVKKPNWIRTDVFNCVEREAMKQVFAEKLLSHDPTLKILGDRADNLSRAIQHNANAGVSDLIQQLLGETLNPDHQTARTAQYIHDQATLRAQEAARI